MLQQFPEDHNNPDDSQVIIAITGTPLYIKEKLIEALEQVNTYGKPIQGTELSFGGTKTTITPVWNKKPY